MKAVGYPTTPSATSSPSSERTQASPSFGRTNSEREGRSPRPASALPTAHAYGDKSASWSCGSSPSCRWHLHRPSRGTPRGQRAFRRTHLAPDGLRQTATATSSSRCTDGPTTRTQWQQAPRKRPIQSHGSKTGYCASRSSEHFLWPVDARPSACHECVIAAF